MRIDEEKVTTSSKGLEDENNRPRARDDINLLFFSFDFHGNRNDRSVMAVAIESSTPKLGSIPVL